MMPKSRRIGKMDMTHLSGRQSSTGGEAWLDENSRRATVIKTNQAADDTA